MMQDSVADLHVGTAAVAVYQPDALVGEALDDLSIRLEALQSEKAIMIGRLFLPWDAEPLLVRAAGPPRSP